MPALLKLLRYHSAGNAIAGVSRGIGLHVVFFGMNDQRRSTIAEERMAIARVSQIDVGVSEFHGGFAVRVDGEVHHIPGVVALGILQAVFLAVRVKVRAGGLEVGTIALGVLVKMDAVYARRQIMQLYVEYHAFGSTLRQGNGSDAFAVGVFHLNHSSGCAVERAENGGEQYRSNE